MENPSRGLLEVVEKLGLEIRLVPWGPFRMECTDGRTAFIRDFDKWDDMVFAIGQYLGEHGYA